MSNELIELKLQKQNIEKKISALKDKKEKELLEEAKKYEGKCFRYPNSDGTNKFYTYMKVKKVRSVWVNDNMEAYSTRIDSIEFDCKPGNPSIHKDDYATLEMWLPYPVSSGEFEKQYKRVLELLK